MGAWSDSFFCMRAGVKDTSLRQRFEFGTQMRQRIRLGYGLKGPRVERSRWRDLLPPLQGGKKVIVPFGSRPHKDDGKQHRRVGRGTRPTLGPHPPLTQPQRGCGRPSETFPPSPCPSHPPFVPFVRFVLQPSAAAQPRRPPATRIRPTQPALLVPKSAASGWLQKGGARATSQSV